LLVRRSAHPGSWLDSVAAAFFAYLPKQFGIIITGK
jgi:hypothetical protein